MNQVDVGFTAQRVLAVGFDLNWSKYNSKDRLRAVSKRLLESPARALPIASDSGVVAGIFDRAVRLCWIGFPPAKVQM